MYRIQVYLGKGKGWKWGKNTYSEEQLANRCIALDNAGIKYRVGSENEMFVD